MEKKIKVACVGNSITYGLGIKNREKNAYPSQLNKILGTGYEVKNFGVSGCTILKRGDMPYWNESSYQEAIDYNPDIVIIKLGTNDAKFHNWAYSREFIADYEEMIAVFKKLPAQPKVYICFPVPLFFAGSDINDTVITRQVIPKIDSIKNHLSIPVIDLYKPLSPHPEHFPDGIHPNADGAKIIAKTVAEFITDQ
ncbi:GDSL-type esterase/lipase family protein [Fulvivirgaceae bacterium BMA12]|uniref:GDSL-type esterase/lipase family protein n=1 Tax=Agaribacillus aureus TaxID=3051825 RepID=A0ABT8L268_9BACT|nr:GDSL-type esterase/lipase family protein [Fulvivirgaceae bacterium BMA12]